MPLLRSASRPQAVECFYCLSTSILPPKIPSSRSASGSGRGEPEVDLSEAGTRWNWKCERCSCWNIRDARGVIRSDMPAMWDSSLNQASFDVRGRPSLSHLPTSFQQNVFCHACLTNQTLIMNLLANYLPADDDSSYAHLHANLPAYVASIHLRYPPVCTSCQPAVDAVLAQADKKASTTVLSHALGIGANTNGNKSGRPPSIWAVGAWRAQGLMWGVSVLVSLVVHVFGIMQSRIPQPQLWGVGVYVPAFFACSVLWAGWDPYWLAVQRRQVGKLTGRPMWQIAMALVTMLRLGSAFVPAVMMDGFRLHLTALGLEIATLACAWYSYRPVAPAALNLVRPVSVNSPSTPIPPSSYSQPQPGSSTNQPWPARAGAPAPAIFGQTSFGGPSRLPPHDPTISSDGTMEWEPSSSTYPYIHNEHDQSGRTYDPRPPALRYDTSTTIGADAENDRSGNRNENHSQWDAFAAGPNGRQRMFARPHKGEETGLEGLMETWGLKDELVDGKGKRGWGSWFG